MARSRFRLQRPRLSFSGFEDSASQMSLKLKEKKKRKITERVNENIRVKTAFVKLKRIYAFFNPLSIKLHSYLSCVVKQSGDRDLDFRKGSKFLHICLSTFLLPN